MGETKAGRREQGELGDEAARPFDLVPGPDGGRRPRQTATCLLLLLLPRSSLFYQPRRPQGLRGRQRRGRQRGRGDAGQMNTMKGATRTPLTAPSSIHLGVQICALPAGRLLPSSSPLSDLLSCLPPPLTPSPPTKSSQAAPCGPACPCWPRLGVCVCVCLWVVWMQRVDVSRYLVTAHTQSDLTERTVHTACADTKHEKLKLKLKLLISFKQQLKPGDLLGFYLFVTLWTINSVGRATFKLYFTTDQKINII